MNYLFYCDFCRYKKISSDYDDLIKVKTSSRSVPQLENNKLKQVELKQQVKFRCPDCGRWLTIKDAAKLEIKDEKDKSPRY